MSRLSALLILLPLTALAQGEPGVQFESRLSWQEVLSKAKAENKYLFVDCTATWCQPCREMEERVFPSTELGAFMNPRFVSVHLQMDRTEHDSEWVKTWYADADAIAKQYQLGGLPAFLFFAPNGELVHKDTGAKNAQEFLTLAADAINPDKQYVRLLSEYRSGKGRYDTMPYLADVTRRFGDEELALKIAADYLHNHLNKMSNAELIKKENLDFVASFAAILSSSDGIFAAYVNQSAVIDDIMGEAGYSSRFVQYVVAKEEVKPVIAAATKSNVEPDWAQLRNVISAKYGNRYVKLFESMARVEWYKHTRDWENYSKYLVSQVEETGTTSASFYSLNQHAWDVFEHSNSKPDLEKALSWVDEALKTPSRVLASSGQGVHAGVLDTRANLLHKLGRTGEAIAVQEQVVKLMEEEDMDTKSFRETLQKMRRGEPTWPQG